MKQILTELKGEIECNAFILVDVNTPPTRKGQINQTENKDTEALNNTLEQMDLQTPTELSTLKQQDTHSFQLHMEHFQE